MEGWRFALQKNRWLSVCIYCMCVCISPYCGQMKYSSVFMAIDQSSAAPMMDTTALIAPPMPSVSLTHILLHSHSFIYLPPPSLTPPFQLCGTQTETNHIFNEIKLGVRPAGKTFISRLLTAAAVAHLTPRPEMTLPQESFRQLSSFYGA